MDDWVVLWRNTLGDEIIINITNARITKTKEAKSNSAEILLPAKDYIVDGNIIFTEGETLVIYAKKGIINNNNLSDDDLLGSFQILNIDINPDDQNFKLICSDLTYSLLANLYSRDITDKTDDIIGNIIQTTAENGLTQTPITTNIASVRSDSTPFPSVNFVSLWKTSYDIFTELSKTEYTGDDKDYIFW